MRYKKRFSFFTLFIMSTQILYSDDLQSSQRFISSFFRDVLDINLDNNAVITFLSNTTIFYSETLSIYSIDDKYYVYLDEKDKKIYNYTATDWMIEKQLEQNESSKKQMCSSEEAFMKIVKLLKYFDFPEDKNYYQILDDKIKDFYNIILNFSLNGVPDRSRIFIASVSKKDYMIKNFFYKKSPLCPPKLDETIKPKTNILQIARDLLGQKLGGNYAPEIPDNATPKLVFAPNINEFELPKARRQQQYLFSYVWELPFKYFTYAGYDKYESTGVVWIDTMCEKIWGISRINIDDSQSYGKHIFHPCKE